MNSSIEKRKQNWIDFYDLNSPVSRILLVSYTENCPVRPMLWWENMKEREEWSYQIYMRQMEDLDKIHDNTIPYLNMLTGTEIFAEAFGCKVHKPDNDMPFARPLIKDVSEFGKIKRPRLEDTNLTKLFDEADHLLDRVGKDALFGLPDIQTPMDIAALIWDKNDFYAAMFDEEPAIIELAGMVKEFMFEFLDEWFRRYGTAFIAHCPEYYMPCGITMSEDEIGIINNEMYLKYYAEELNEFSERYGAIGIHTCADAKHQWPYLKKIQNLKLLNLAYRPDLKEGISYFSDSVAQWPGDFSLTDGLPDAQNIHMAKQVVVKTREEAIAYADRFNEEMAK